MAAATAGGVDSSIVKVLKCFYLNCSNELVIMARALFKAAVAAALIVIGSTSAALWCFLHKARK